MEDKHSKLGVSSFLLSISVIVCSSALFAVITILRARVNQGGEFADMMKTLYGLFGVIIAALTLIGLGLGIAGIVQKTRKKAFAVAGVCIASAVIACALIALLLLLQ